MWGWSWISHDALGHDARMGVFDFFSRQVNKLRGKQAPSGRMGFRGAKLVNLNKPIVTENVLGGLFGEPGPSRAKGPKATLLEARPLEATLLEATPLEAYPTNEEELFLHFGKWIRGFSSSNVGAFRYLPETEMLFVAFHGGKEGESIYGYEPV